MFRASLQILIIIWWVGAGIASIAIVIHRYEQYTIIGTAGWIMIASTALIIYEIKRIKEEDKELMERRGG